MKQSRFVERCSRSKHRCMKIRHSFGDVSSYQVPKENLNSWLNRAKNLSVERDGDTFFKLSKAFKNV